MGEMVSSAQFEAAQHFRDKGHQSVNFAAVSGDNRWRGQVPRFNTDTKNGPLLFGRDSPVSFRKDNIEGKEIKPQLYERYEGYIDERFEHLMQKSKKVGENVIRIDDEYWHHYIRNSRKEPNITGKYLFFSEYKEELDKIAIDELENNGFFHAKISTD